jgi:hypothetical protein
MAQRTRMYDQLDQFCCGASAVATLTRIAVYDPSQQLADVDLPCPLLPSVPQNSFLRCPKVHRPLRRVGQLLGGSPTSAQLDTLSFLAPRPQAAEGVPAAPRGDRNNRSPVCAAARHHVAERTNRDSVGRYRQFSDDGRTDRSFIHRILSPDRPAKTLDPGSSRFRSEMSTEMS